MTFAAQLVPFISPAEIEASIPGTIAHLHAHRILAYPTETVYGFGGSIDRESVDALIQLKGRPANKPILLLISSTDMLLRLGLRLPTYAAALASHFWPGPLTLVLPDGSPNIPASLRNAKGGIAVRWTSHAGMLRLIQRYDAPITSTSANRPGAPAAVSGAAILGDWREEITSGLIRLLDGGPLAFSPPSTVVDCIGPRPRLIRPGAIPVAALREAAPALIATPDLS